MRNIRCLLLLLLLLGGAAAGGCIPKESPAPLVERVPYKILLHYSSELPHPDYVLSGPFQSYQRFVVNESFQRRLEIYAAAKSIPSATRTLELSVHVQELLTTCDRLGGLPEDQGRAIGGSRCGLAERLAVVGLRCTQPGPF